MTTPNSLDLKIDYVRGTECREPEVRLGFRVPFLLRLKLLFWLLFGKTIWHSLTEEEIENISHKIVRWRLVSKLRAARRLRGKTKVE